MRERASSKTRELNGGNLTTVARSSTELVVIEWGSLEVSSLELGI